MSLSSLWPPLPEGAILFEDEDLVAIDKPPFAPTHAPDGGRDDDAISRLRLVLAARAGVDPSGVYLGVHQRLDRDTSGVLVFSRRKSANASLAAQFEGRRVKKTYLAAVGRFGPTAREGVLRHKLAPAEGGAMRVVPEKARGQEAVTRYRVLARGADRTLLELQPETGRTHQIRVQLAAIGAPVAGDALYGGPEAPRLCLHARRLELRHPRTDARLVLEAPAPAEIEAWTRGPAGDPLASVETIRAALSRAAAARYTLGRARELGTTTAFRLAHEDGDGLPGVAVDVYGDHLLVHLSSPEAEAARERVLDAAFSLGPRGVYVMSHPKQSSNLVDPRRGDRAPPRAVRGEDAPSPLVVREGGLAYETRLGDGLKTGIFLDQRENRRRVRELSAGKRVLNLFAYTCAFTVAAAAGGASRTVSVDTTRGMLDWGLANLGRNGLEGGAHQTIDADAIAWLAQAASRGERFDLVVLDPPSFATTRTTRFSAESDYKKLAKLAMAVLADGGRLVACTNHRGIVRAKLRRWLHEAARELGREAKQVKDWPDPADFPPPWGREPHLKTMLVTLA